MGTTHRRTKANRRLPLSFRAEFDPLELRLALSASVIVAAPSATAAIPPSPSLSIVSVTPANASVLATSPATFTVTFDRPIDPFSLGNDDVEILHVSSDGATSPLLPGEAQTSESLDPSDPSDRRLVLGLSKKLVDGSYELVLGPDSQIQGEDGSTPAEVGPARVLTNFSVGSAGSGRTAAIPLPMLGPVESSESGDLDLADDPSRVQYYKFTLAPGHHWLLGLEIEGHLDGSNLNSTLSLFDSGGRLVSTSSQGLSDDRSDPYLFAGLDAGTYYVGISAQKNIPDAAGNYLPSLTSIDSTGEGGSFRLDMVVDPADQAAQVLGIQLDHSDPASTAPTGLTLQFSGALDVTKLQSADAPALELVDSQGADWPVSTLAYNASEGQLTLLFDRPLAPGTYSLEPTGPASFTDIAGRLPVANGLAAGILGSFDVGRSTTQSDDLGLVLPSGLASNLAIPPGPGTVERFVVINPGLHAIEGISQGSGVDFSVEDLQGHVLATGPSSTADSTEVDLTSGSYQIVFTSKNPGPSDVPLVIRQLEGHAASFLDLGVAQGPALNLRLVTPQVGFGSSTVLSTTSVLPMPTTGTATTPADATSNADPREVGGGPKAFPTAISIHLSTPGGPSVAGLMTFFAPVGQPSAGANQVGIVTSSGASSLAVVASNGEGVPAGLIVIPETPSGGGALEPRLRELEGGAGQPVSGPTRGGASMAEGILARTPSSRRADDRTLEEADWSSHLIETAFSWYRGLSTGDKVEVADVAQVVSSDVPATDKSEFESAAEESRPISASMGSPLLIGGVLGAIACHYRRRFAGHRSERNGKGYDSQNRPIPSGKPHLTIVGPRLVTRKGKLSSNR